MEIKSSILYVLIFVTSSSIFAQYKIQESVFGTAGTNSSTTDFILKGTMGEQFVSHMQSSSNILHQGFWNSVSITTDVKKEEGLPEDFQLYQNYPNPFNPSTIIKFAVPERSNVLIKIYDILGSEVVTLVNEEMDAGWYEKDFNASGFSSGVYLFRMEAGSYVSTKKMILLR